MLVNFVSAFILGALLWGRSLAKIDIRRHIQVMCFVVIADTSLVIGLTFFRDVFGTISNRMTPLLAVHILMALTSLILYYLAVYFGFRVWKGQTLFLKRLKRTDKLLVPLRIGTLVTSLLMYFTKAS